MKFLLKSGLIATLCFMLVIQTGCWDQRLYEEIGFILQIGFETGPEDQLIMSAALPAIEEDIKEDVEFLTVSTEKLTRSSQEKMRNFSGRMLLRGKTQQILFSKQLAHKGINEFLEAFARNPENPVLANIIIVDGSPKEMMEIGIKYKDKPRLSFYVASLLRDAQRRYTAPETRIYDFSIKYHSKTIDPVTPLLRYDKEKLEIIGSALFCGDKMVGEIDVFQTVLLNALIEKKRVFEYVYKGGMPGGNEDLIKRGAGIMVTQFKRRIETDIIDGIPLLKVHLDFNAMLDEHADEHKLRDDDYKNELEELIGSAIKDEILTLLRHLQKVGSDPIGFGEKIRATQNNYWRAVDWRNIYKKAEFYVTTNVNIDFYGSTE